MLLSGMTLVGSMQDAVTGYMLTALARLGDALFLTAGIVVILISLLGRHLMPSRSVHVDATTTLTPGMPLPILVAVSGCGAVRRVPDDRELCAATFCGHRRTLSRIAELVLIGLSAAGFGASGHPGPRSASALATLISRQRAPALVTATAGIMPMLPGLRSSVRVRVRRQPIFADGRSGQLLEAAAATRA